jgi:mannose-1-phosphate guanylyltransferase
MTRRAQALAKADSMFTLEPVHAFLPGAGLGTRLRPLTDQLPKPLVTLFHRPLVEHALEACHRAGAGGFAINTHHLAGHWDPAFPTIDGPPLRGGNGEPARHSTWLGNPVTFFHEPILLETGGGVKNIEPWFGQGSLLVHNADIFSTMAVEQLVAAHRASGAVATLAIRSSGPALHVAVDLDRGLVTDIRNFLGHSGGTHQFTGIYCAERELLDLIPAGEKVSVIPAFLELINQSRLGCVVLDEGAWFDLGTPGTLLAAHLDPPVEPALPRIHPQASVDPAANVDALSWIGPGASVPAGAALERSLVLPGAAVPAGTHSSSIILPDGTSISIDDE